jgi:6-phospho-beta-glucosidase
MKIAVIGGAGVRTPLLVSGLVNSDLTVDHVSLYDEERERLEIIGRIAELMSGRPVNRCASVDECISGADFVFTSIRVGGIERRVHDEAVAQRHGIAGQETVGPAGFAMAARTIPPMVDYAKQIARIAPEAWTINFTNPVGMVTEAMRSANERVIGICDTPTELFEEVARTLDLQSEHCHFDYFGLNHLGWLREVYYKGIPQLHQLWSDPVRLRAVYRVPLFDPSFLRELRLLPTEYVFYYVRPVQAFENLRGAGVGRGQVIEALTHALFDDLAAPNVDIVSRYKAYLFSRSAGYMQIESGSSAPSAPAPATGLSGYDRIALGVVRAICFNVNTIIPLSVANRGAIPSLLDDDVVEVPCVVNGNGARPLQVGGIPDRVAPLIAQVREYERLTVRAALTQSTATARDALARNPLVPEAAVDRLIADLSPLW